MTLKRGVIGDLRFFERPQATREGNHDARTVTVMLLDEPAPRSASGSSGTHSQEVVAPTLAAKGAEPAMEELGLVAVAAVIDVSENMLPSWWQSTDGPRV